MEYSSVTVAETVSFRRKFGQLLFENEKANITKEEKNILSAMVRELVNYWSQR